MKKTVIILSALFAFLLCSCSTVVYDPNDAVGAKSVKADVSFARISSYDNAGAFMWKYADGFSTFKTGDYPFAFIDSLSSLDAFKKQGELFFDLEFDWDELDSFTDVTTSLDDSFFKNNTLIVVFFTETSGSIRHRIRECFVDSGVLNVTIEEIPTNDGVTDDMADWLAVLSFDKKELKGVNSFLFLADDNRSVSGNLTQRVYPDGTKSPAEVYHIGTDYYVFDSDDSYLLKNLFETLEYSKEDICECDSTDYLVEFSQIGVKYAVSTKEGYVRKIDISGDSVFFGQADLSEDTLSDVKTVMSRLKGNL